MSATDEDSGKFGQISYSIKSPSTAKSIFQIDSSAGKNVSGTSGGRVVRTLLALPWLRSACILHNLILIF